MKVILAIASALLLTGCVVAPAPVVVGNPYYYSGYRSYYYPGYYAPHRYYYH